MSPSIEYLRNHIEQYEDIFAYENAVSPEVHAALVKHAKSVDVETCEPDDEQSFYVADLGAVRRNLEWWRHELPFVDAHYAVKCNPDPEVLAVLGAMGAGFDCALKQEIDLVLGMGFDAERIVYANPCKTPSYVRHARTVGVNLTTVDNADELHKIRTAHLACRVLIRIVTDDETAQCPLSTKFGCTVNKAVAELLPLARELGMEVAGVAFHVGLGARDFNAMTKAVRDAREIFDSGDRHGFAMNVLDIGGGFEGATFGALAEATRGAIAKYFPREYASARGIRMIAEPGRFLVANAFTLATNVIARRDVPAKTGLDAMLYLNDGVYGNLNCILFDHQGPQAYTLEPRGTRHRYSLWGPTCDGLDRVAQKADLWGDVQVGDWVFFPDMGAYTSAATTAFNGFASRAPVTYVGA